MRKMLGGAVGKKCKGGEDRNMGWTVDGDENEVKENGGMALDCMIRSLND